MRQRELAFELQKQNQQGLGKPIQSNVVHLERSVIVNDTVLRSKHWLTFHQFLLDYLDSSLGEDWISDGSDGSDPKTHPLFDMRSGTQYMRLRSDADLELPLEPRIVALSAEEQQYLRLAYDLYSLKHNAEVQQKLIGRLRRTSQFESAVYEIFVAASMVRAGCHIEFENEDDRSSSHCEFVATFKSGEKFSVEAKRLQNRLEKNQGKFKIIKHLNNALRKRADHPRVIFIDTNSEHISDYERFVDYVTDLIRRRETEAKLPSPPAYVFVTNMPVRPGPRGVSHAYFYLGFNMPSFRYPLGYPNLRAALDGRIEHAAIFALIKSMETHGTPPATFDGSIGQQALGLTTFDLKIGDRYEADVAGQRKVATLMQGSVVERDSCAFLVSKLEDGSHHYSRVELTHNDLVAWRASPTTYFGAPEVVRDIRTPLDFYDWFLAANSMRTREELMEILAVTHAPATLANLSRDEMLEIFVVGMTEQMKPWPSLANKEA